MAKWKSPAQREAEEFQAIYKQYYPELEKRMQEFVDSYDESQLVEEDMKTLTSPVSLLRRRMAKYCVWPYVRSLNISLNHQSNLVTQSIEQFAKPMQDQYNAKKRAEEHEKRKTFEAAAQLRVIVDEGLGRQSFDLGELVIVGDRVLTCLSCENIKADEDIGQFDSGYYHKFAEPTDEEKATDAYKRAQEKMETDQKRRLEEEKRLEALRQSELNAIRSSGQEPDWMDEFFAGTGDN